MKRVIIICEGETEKEFCNTILTPYFAKKDIFIQSPLIKKSMGGIVKWSELKKQITLHLTNDSKAFVTTLIDYYGCIANTISQCGMKQNSSQIKIKGWKYLSMGC
ncbi:MAG: DUF4276 family protein [Prolixibacteraceae bacterium]|jgi:hypothetical protein|nr:DUF4276 family protein [Prolixibacteraceae bacterium]